jgi:hypothetical protein
MGRSARQRPVGLRNQQPLITRNRKNLAAFEKAGGQGKFFGFDTPGDVGHDVIHYPDLWDGPVGDYLNSLS